MLKILEEIKENGAIVEANLPIIFEPEILIENGIIRIFSKNDDNDILVTKEFLEENDIEECDDEIYGKVEALI